MMKKIIVFIIIATILYPFVSSVPYVVDEQQYAIVHSSSSRNVVTEPGVYFKLPMPIQSVEVLDLKVQINETLIKEILTTDKKKIYIDASLFWKISDPQRFFAKFKSDQKLIKKNLDDLVTRLLSEEIAHYTLSEIISGDKEKMLLSVKKQSLDELKNFGINVLDVRFKDVNLIDGELAARYEIMKEEQEKTFHAIREEGILASGKLRSEAEVEAAQVVSKARQEAEAVRAEADAKVTQMYIQATGPNTEFMKFWRSLKAYEQMFKDKDVVVLDKSSEFLKYMKPAQLKDAQLTDIQSSQPSAP